VLTELGIPRLWGEDPERCWPVARFMVGQWIPYLCPSAGYGLDRVPVAGGGVVAANHFGTIDPALIGIYSRRAIYYMAKIELVSVPVVGEILRWTGTFSVRRGEGDRDAVRVARWLVREGHLVGMFMEGTRQHFGYPGPVHAGAVMLAIQEEAPVIPCGIDTFRWTMRNRRRCALVWGEPISLAGLPRNGKGYREGAEIVEAELVRLWRMAAQAVVDGLPEQLADGTRRGKPVKPWEGEVMRGLRPWPDQPWAAEPLGPLYRGSAPGHPGD
jgi:1-acyl-sn-glycerol-3-phosphate acyltransferase